MAASTIGPDPGEIPESLRLDIALASRILAKQGILDAFGHVSCRHPQYPSTYFLMSSNKAPAAVLPSDVQVYRIDNAEPFNKSGPRGFLERFLHSETYKRFRPEDVGGMVHCHTTEFLPFSLARVLPFKAAIHMASFLGHHPAPVFDLADAIGEHNDCLVRDAKAGAALARCFDLHEPIKPKKKGFFSSNKKQPYQSAARALVLMRGHGATITALDVRLAVFRAIYARDNARVLMSLHSLLGGIPGLMTQGGHHQGVRLLAETEAELSASSNASQIDRAWNVWAADVVDSIPGASLGGTQYRSNRQSYDTTGGRSYDDGEYEQQTSRSYTRSPDRERNLSSYPATGGAAIVQRQPSTRQSIAPTTQTARQEQQQAAPASMTHAQHIDAILNRSGTVDHAANEQQTAALPHATQSTAAPIGGFGGATDLSRNASVVRDKDYGTTASVGGATDGHSTAAAEPGAALEPGATTAAANKSSGMSWTESTAKANGGAPELVGGQAAEQPAAAATSKSDSVLPTEGGATDLGRSGSVLSHATICPHCSKQIAL